MRVETLGEGTPAVAVVGAIHGDEPCGVHAIERFLAEEHRIREPVKLVVANERALARGERYVEADEPFGTLATADATKARLMRAMPVAHAADFAGVVEGRSVNLPGFVNVEAGRQGTDRAAENAYECVLAFLRATGVLPGDPDPSETLLYDVFDSVEKEPGRAYEVLVSNFERVPAGEPYATVDGDSLRADREFWPVLMSADGHERLLGYRARLAGPIRDAVDARTDAD